MSLRVDPECAYTDQGYQGRGTNTGDAYIWVSRLEVLSLEVPRPGVPRLGVPRQGVLRPGAMILNNLKTSYSKHQELPCQISSAMVLQMAFHCDTIRFCPKHCPFQYLS